MGFLWSTYSAAKVVCEILWGILWSRYGTPTGFLCSTYSAAKSVCEILCRVAWYGCGMPMAFLWSTYSASKCMYENLQGAMRSHYDRLPGRKRPEASVPPELDEPQESPSAAANGEGCDVPGLDSTTPECADDAGVARSSPPRPTLAPVVDHEIGGTPHLSQSKEQAYPFEIEITKGKDVGDTSSNVIPHKTEARLNIGSDTVCPVPTSKPTNFITLEVPWLNGKHDGYRLSSFLGYEELRYSRAHLDEVPFAERAALHQSHLTFGLIEAVTQQKIPECYLLRRVAPGMSFLTTDNLRHILRDWINRIHKLEHTDVHAHSQWIESVHETLSIALDLFLLETQSSPKSVFNKSGLSQPDVDSILCMIAGIIEALVMTSSHFGRQPPDAIWSRAFVGPVAERYRTKLARRGWCPFTIHMLSTKLCTLGFATTCQPSIRRGVGHRQCTRDACVINTIDTTKYSNSHIEPGCSCPYLKPSVDEVIGHLSNGSIPVITVRVSPNNAIPVNSCLCPRHFRDGTVLDAICTSTIDTPYVAISHVWADGLGSTTEVGLPTCQLRWVTSTARRLVPGGAIWLDGLCVPKEKESRKRAIGLMGKTYRDAAVVLVLDSGIQSCSVKAPIAERLLRIVTSGWMQRLWTLQEAVLARRIVFQFADGFTDIQTLVSEADFADPVEWTLISGVGLLVKEYVENSNSNGCGIGYVVRSLHWRSTSKLEDETLAIASLLNVSAYELVQLSPEERMERLLLMVKNVQSNIAFLGGQKLDKPGFRWATKSFITRGEKQIAVRQRDAICTAEGLHATFFSFAFETTSFKKRWIIRDTSKSDPKYFHVNDVTKFKEQITTAFSCNAIIFEFPQVGLVNVGAAVLFDRDNNNAAVEGSRLKCIYVRRLRITQIDEGSIASDAGGDQIIDIRSAGMVTVCLS
ncbi:hypothetical protein OBBRIDRAFT_890380 [Obba rivulosa]|uniref:Heterokaryon incompatibility domain-containing protein n=1 Tax=Obba rivulosa TaxID=1052685 RepID=A0A8E2DH40_9APHY|nr:hypothetical protein OBBRIDRAFT_890380 [Obba rivulosa]